MINAPIDIDRMLEDHIYIRDLVKMNYDIKQDLMIGCTCRILQCRGVQGQKVIGINIETARAQTDEARTRSSRHASSSIEGLLSE